MKLLVIVLCLLSERFLMHAVSYSRFFWFAHYVERMEEIPFISKQLFTPWLGLLILIFPLLFIVSLVGFLIADSFYGVFGLILNIIVFYYCLGPDNPFYPKEQDLGLEENREQVVDYLYKINRQLFSTIFWYVIAGIPGVLLYRLATLCLNVNAVSSEAKILTDIMEWLPVRMLGLLCLLTGNFQRGFLPWKNRFFSQISENRIFLADCGLEALRSEPQEVLTVTLAEHMVNQALIVLLVILAICTNVAWL